MPDQAPSNPTRSGSTILAFAMRLALFAALWLILTEADPRKWWFGAAIVTAVAIVSLKLLPPSTQIIRPLPLLLFIPFFLHRSLLGGIDISLRVIRPRMRIAPKLYDMPLRLDPGPARLWMVATVSLMPGTLACHLKENSLQMHLLDDAMRNDPNLRRLERRVGAIFGQRLDPIEDTAHEQPGASDH